MRTDQRARLLVPTLLLGTTVLFGAVLTPAATAQDSAAGTTPTVLPSSGPGVVPTIPPPRSGSTGPTWGRTETSHWTWTYYLISVQDWTPQLRVTVTSEDPHTDLFLRRNEKPTLEEHLVASTTPFDGNEELVLDDRSRPSIESGLYWIGVYHQESAEFDIEWAMEPLPSKHAGMGSIPYAAQGPHPAGTAFRVFAPFADSVHVAGEFNNWVSSSAPLYAEGNGNWSLDVRELGVGARYKYVVRNGADVLWRNDPRALEVTQSNGDSVVFDPSAYTWNDAGYSTPTWDELVVYEMHVGTFEGLPGPPVGSLDSAITRLDHLEWLGVNAIELMPVNEFAGDVSWGYNPGHPFSVEQAYGGPEALQRFVDAAHQRGIAVLLDVLYNHWGPSDLALWQFDGWSEDGYGGIYFYNDIKAVTPWGDTRPDFGRPEVRQYIRDNVLLWLETYRMDGLRWDSTSNIRMTQLGDNPDGWSLMQWSNDEIDAKQGWKISIAEDMFDAPNNAITNDTLFGGAGFDSQWDALFVHPVRAAVITPNDADRNMWSVRDAIAYSYNGDAFQRVVFTESHDEVANGKSRVPEEIWPGNADSYFSKKRSMLGAAVMFGSPGVPMLFQGQEFLEDEYFTDTDPLDWAKLDLFPGIAAFYRDMIRLRRNMDGVSAGLRGQSTNVFHVNDFDKVIAWHRWNQGGPGDDVVVLCNFANQAWSAAQNYRIGLPQPGTWNVRLNSDWTGYDPGFGDHPSNAVVAEPIPYDGLPYSGTVSFGPYTCIVLSQ